MNIEEMKAYQKKLKEEHQNKYINNLLEMVENLLEKSNKKDYEPTEHEKRTLQQIYNIISDMVKWF